jgi:hypothetical protein
VCGPRWLRWSESEPLYDAPWLGRTHALKQSVSQPQRLILPASSRQVFPRFSHSPLESIANCIDKQVGLTTRTITRRLA